MLDLPLTTTANDMKLLENVPVIYPTAHPLPHNLLGPLHRLAESEDGFEKNNGFELEVNLPLRRHGVLSQYSPISMETFLIKIYFYWLYEVKHFYNLMEVPHGKTVKLVAYKLKGGVAI